MGPASNWDRPLLNFVLGQASRCWNYFVLALPFAVLAASQGVPAHSVYEKGGVVRGHHIYKTCWTPVIEELPVEREEDNQHDEHLVAMMKYGAVVGHMPCSISRLSCFYFWSVQGIYLTYKMWLQIPRPLFEGEHALLEEIRHIHFEALTLICAMKRAVLRLLQLVI